MKNNRLQKFESKIEPETSPEQIKQSREMFVNLLTPIIEKMLKNPSGIRPVHESFQELARQAKGEIVRQPTIIDSGGGSLEVPKKSTDIDIEVPQKFTDFEMELLRKIQNGE